MITSAGNLAQRTIPTSDSSTHSMPFYGIHPGYRPVHAKGIVCAGTFRPAATAASVSRAPHLQGAPVPITVRPSDFAGVSTVPDGDPLPAQGYGDQVPLAPWDRHRRRGPIV